MSRQVRSSPLLFVLALITVTVSKRAPYKPENHNKSNRTQRVGRNLENGLHCYIALLSKVPHSCLTFIHRRRCQPCKVTTNTSGAVRVRRRLAQGHLDIELDRRPGIEPATFLLPDPLLPPELLPPKKGKEPRRGVPLPSRDVGGARGADQADVTRRPTEHQSVLSLLSYF